MNPASTATVAPKRRRRWFQYSLRTLLIGTTLFAIWLGWWVNRSKNIPTSWDIRTGRNIKWSAKVGLGAWPPGLSGLTVVTGGKVFVGSRSPTRRGGSFGTTDACLLCLDDADGGLLWQFSSKRLQSGRVHDSPQNPICSTPYVEQERLWMVTNRCEVVCLDTEGFYDGENDGPYRNETAVDKNDADVIWKLDMMGELGVRPHELAGSSVTGAGDLIFLNTGNAVGADNRTIPSPEAPSFLAMDKNTGRIVWSDNSPGTNILHGQWSSPAYGVLGDQPQVIFAGGDGWLYSFDPAGEGHGRAKLLWKFDCNPKKSEWILGGRGDRNNLIAKPVIYEDRVYVGVGQDGEHGRGVGHLWCIDPGKRGDVSPELVFNSQSPDEPIPHKRFQACDTNAGDFTRPNPNSALVWHYGGWQDPKQRPEGIVFDRTSNSVAIKDDLLFAVDLIGYLHCLDAKTGQLFWKHGFLFTVVRAPLIADGKVFIGNEDGDMMVFRASADPEVAMNRVNGNLEPLATMYMGDIIFSAPTVADGVLYIGTEDRLYAIQTD